MTTLRVTMIDNKPAVFLPEGAGITEGSAISFDGTVLRVEEDDADGQLAAMRRVMTEDRVALAKLAE